MHRALCLAGAKPSSRPHDEHLYTPLPVAYLERGVTSLGDDVSDIDVSEGEQRGGVRVTYTTTGCCASPVRVAASSVGIKLARDEPLHDNGAVKLRRLLCCRKRDKVLLLLLTIREAAWCVISLVSVGLLVCLSVCLLDDDFRKP